MTSATAGATGPGGSLRSRGAGSGECTAAAPGHDPGVNQHPTPPQPDDTDHTTVWFEQVPLRELRAALGPPEKRRLRHRLERLVAAMAVAGVVGTTAGMVHAAGLEGGDAAPAATETVTVPSGETTPGDAGWSANAEPPTQVLEILDTIRAAGEPMLSQWVPARCAPVEALFSAAGLPAWMTVVSWRESRCDPSARNLDLRTEDDSWGLFQINTLGDLWNEIKTTCGLERPEALLDAATNAVCAGRLFALYGYKPWHAGVYFG